MRPVLLICLVFLIAGCAGKKAFRQGIDLSDHGQIEEGLEKIEQASKEDPNNLQYRVALVSRRSQGINTLLQEADSLLNESKLSDAETQYTRVLNIDKNNVRAQAGLKQVTQARRHAELLVEANLDFDSGDFASVAEKTRAVLLENPKHRDAMTLRGKVEGAQAKNQFTPPTLRKYNSPLTLEFRDAPVKMVFDVLSTTTGVNFILDKDLRPEQRVSIFVKQVTFDKALSMLLESNQLDRKIINENTVIVYPRNPQKSQEYEELVVKTFYLTNADPKQTSNMLRTILKVRDIFVDDRLNMMVVRDTPENIRLAEKLIASQDLADPEVLLDVTVVEIKRSKILDLGIQPPSQLGLITPREIVGDASVALPLTLQSFTHLNRSNISVGGTPSVNFNQSVSNLNVLANPSIRVRNREKAKIHVGDRVPIISASLPATTGGGTTETITYVDVGIKLEVEPNIYLEGSVAIKVALEVSSLGQATTTKNGTLVYQIGTRNTSTLLRLKDGETQLLAGLINDQDRKAVNGLPGLADLPLIGRLFASHKDEREKTEIVLSITPHIVRNIERPSAGEMQFWSGTATGGQGAYTDAFMSQGGMRDPSRFGLPREPGMPPTPFPLPEPFPEPIPEPEPEPTPEQTPEQVPEPTPESTPEPESRPWAEPATWPTPEPEPEPEQAGTPDPAAPPENSPIFGDPPPSDADGSIVE